MSDSESDDARRGGPDSGTGPRRRPGKLTRVKDNIKGMLGIKQKEHRHPQRVYEQDDVAVHGNAYGWHGMAAADPNVNKENFA